MPEIIEQRLREYISALDEQIDIYEAQLRSVRGSGSSLPNPDSTGEVLRFLRDIKCYTGPGGVTLGNRNTLVRVIPELGLQERIDPFVEVFPELRIKP